MLRTLQLKQSSLPTSGRIWARLLLEEMMQLQTPDAIALLRQAGMEPDPWQVAAGRSPAPRQLWLCSRQSGKSSLAAALALATALPQPGSLVLLLSPSLRQSSELFKKVLELYRLQEAPLPAAAESALRLELVNGSRLVSLPGTEGTVRGFSGVRLLIVDEASRVQDELFYAIRPMLAVSGGRMLCLSTPFGKRGFFYREYTEGEGWERTKVTAYDCPRISQAFLAEEQRMLPPLWFQSEYLCEFVDTVDQVFLSEHVQAALTSEVQPLF